MTPITRRLFLAAAVAGTALPLLGGCVYQPLYGSNDASTNTVGSDLSYIAIDEVDDRVAQQVRNQLIFLFNGGRDAPEPRYQLSLRTRTKSREYAADRNYHANTAGEVTVQVSYKLVDIQSTDDLAQGKQRATAFYDLTGQSFANERAERDAENRAAKDVAERLRMMIAAELSKL